jgi:hypothetical protein
MKRRMEEEVQPLAMDRLQDALRTWGKNPGRRFLVSLSLAAVSPQLNLNDLVSSYTRYDLSRLAQKLYRSEVSQPISRHSRPSRER